MNFLGYALSYFTLFFFTVLIVWAIDRVLYDKGEREKWASLCGIGLMFLLVNEGATLATNHIGYPFWLFVVTSLS